MRTKQILAIVIGLLAVACVQAQDAKVDQWSDPAFVAGKIESLPRLAKPLCYWPRHGPWQDTECFERFVQVVGAVGYNLNYRIAFDRFGRLNELVEKHDLMPFALLQPYYTTSAGYVAADGNLDFDHLDDHLAYVRDGVAEAAGVMVRPPAYVLLNTELFDCGDDWPGRVARARLDLAYGLIKSQWPDAQIVWFCQGCSGWKSDAFGWSEISQTVAPGVLGDAWSIGLYQLDQRYLTRQTMRRALEHASEYGVGQVIPWLGLGYSVHYDWTQRTWSQLPYGQVRAYGAVDDAAVWELGWELNRELPVSGRSTWVDWARAPIVCSWPSPWEGADLRAAWWRNFYAYACGAAGVTPDLEASPCSK